MVPNYPRCAGCGAQLGVNGGWHSGNCPLLFRLDQPTQPITGDVLHQGSG